MLRSFLDAALVARSVPCCLSELSEHIAPSPARLGSRQNRQQQLVGGHTDPANRMPQKCFVVMAVGDTKFERAYPLADKDSAVYNNNDHKGMACPNDALVYLPQQPGADKYKLP